MVATFSRDNQFIWTPEVKRLSFDSKGAMVLVAGKYKLASGVLLYDKKEALPIFFKQTGLDNFSLSGFYEVYYTVVTIL